MQYCVCNSCNSDFHYVFLCDGLDVGQTAELSPHVRHEENYMLGTMTLLIEGELQSEVIH